MRAKWWCMWWFGADNCSKRSRQVAGTMQRVGEASVLTQEVRLDSLRVSCFWQIFWQFCQFAFIVLSFVYFCLSVNPTVNPRWQRLLGFYELWLLFRHAHQQHRVLKLNSVFFTGGLLLNPNHQDTSASLTGKLLNLVKNNSFGLCCLRPLFQNSATLVCVWKRWMWLTILLLCNSGFFQQHANQRGADQS